jgi:cobalt transport protein ATP-binding subunit
MLDYKQSAAQSAVDRSSPVVVAVEGLSFAYPDGHVALRDINVELRAGERTALVGQNGSGKSTLLLHLNGILRGEGRISIGGIELTDETVRHIRSMVGLVFQNPDDQLFSATVFDDVAYGPLYMGMPRKEIAVRVKEALEAVDMAGFEERMPHHLSIGQRKRVSLATVLSMDPKVLVLDEPSAGLDPRSRRSLIELLQRLPHTVFASTHDMHLVRDLFDRMIVLDEGRIVADKPTAELLNDEPFLTRYGLEPP